MSTMMDATQIRTDEAGAADALDVHLGREWLITNGRGGFASGTVPGVPTRRYHGLLIAAARPPLERWLLLSAVLEKVGLGDRWHEFGSFAFDQTIHPQGYRDLTGFAARNRGPLPWVRFGYEHEGVVLTKTVVMPRSRDEVWLRYRVQGPPGEPLALELCPFVAMRDFHALTQAFTPGFDVRDAGAWVAVNAAPPAPRLWLHAQYGGDGAPITLDPQPDWWYGFEYRQELARGQDHREDLFVPGWFKATGSGTLEVDLRAIAVASREEDDPPAPIEPPSVETDGADAPTIEDRLTEAADAFVVTRQRDSGTDLTTILAGYHWFGDWGRDTFIALPGLLVETGRFAEARQVLEVFASAMRDGLIPNRFSDYGDGRDYNSVDASLWFIHAADAYVAASGDDGAWREFLAPACLRVVDAFTAGTQFNIGVGDDGLVTCGDASTQLTWMDAKCGDVIFTPRHGKAVEINALWYHGLCILADRLASYDPERARQCRELASRAHQAFVPVFWNDAGGYLYDVVRDDWKDPAVRPNQIFAVSLPHSMLDRPQQRAVLECVGRELLTPVGLRSLCRRHPGYRPHYGGDLFQRDGAYHQGTVWGWLIGPYVEAYLRVHDFTPEARHAMRRSLQPLIDHLDDAGIGSISEIFDGDPPHTPNGSIAQAWSVAELLRAWHLTA